MGMTHKNDVINRVCQFIKIMSNQKVTRHYMTKELGICDRVFRRYIQCLSLHFLVCSELESPGKSNRYVYWIQKGQGKQKTII